MKGARRTKAAVRADNPHFPNFPRAMPSPALLLNLFLDLVARGEQPRVPEPALVMDDPAAAEAFMRAGREDGMLAHTYVYHAIQASAVIPAGGTVLDLGCGPANQLVQVARLNPDARFIGVDASPAMLALARETLARCDVGNVTLREAQMQALADIPDASVDAVISTMSLHHLTDFAALAATLAEVKRVLRPGGGVYLVDFGRLRRAAGQHFFAHERAASQPQLFTTDYHHSLRAAFSLAELQAAARVLGAAVRVRRTFLVPFLVAIRSRQPNRLRRESRAAARALYLALSPRQRFELRDLARFFGHGGFPLAYRPWWPWHRGR